MGFDYNKNKNGDGHDSLWTSYSDLFMGLSFVFLLLYVTASVRTGATGIQQTIQMRQVSMENEDLKNQLKVYNSLKKDYLETEASPEEEKLYENLIGQLDLLQDQAKTEKDKLRAAANANAKKEQALNEYQQMVRNIMNANVIAKSRIKKRNVIIEEQDVEIEDLETTVEEKKQQIAENEKQITNMNTTLDKKVKQLNFAYKQQQMTEKAYQEQMAQARQDHDRRMAALKSQQAKAQSQLQEVSSQLAATQGELVEKEGLVAQKATEAANLQRKLAGAEKDHSEQVAAMRAAFDGQRAKDRAAFEDQMNREKLGAAERAAREAAYRAQSARKERELGERIAGLQGKLQGTEGELAKARAEAAARRNVADEIKRGFAKAGVKAEVDGETGDITLDFGDHYFDTGRADLKQEMAKVLHKAIPVYAKSLMENKKVADKITNIEIIGFASPTYQGRVVDPKSMKPEDRKAVEYNMDLSYQRARSIFQYVFDQNKMSFEHQKDIRPLVKVSGKSFFEAAKINRTVAGESVKDFCKKYDCKKSQRVLIKFTVDQK